MLRLPEADKGSFMFNSLSMRRMISLISVLLGGYGVFCVVESPEGAKAFVLFIAALALNHFNRSSE
jgi:hypothetical protein